MTTREKAAYAIATWFGAGLVPRIPGTAGSIAAIPLAWGLSAVGVPAVALAAALVTAVGIWAADVVVERSGAKDPPIVVVDEVAGMLVTALAAAPDWRSQLGGFVLFRIADQTKPFPARAAERRLPGGWGVVLDDVAAGVWSAAALATLRWFHWL